MATLPVSMDDLELFPRKRKLSAFLAPQPHVLVENRSQRQQNGHNPQHSPSGSEKSDGSADSWSAEVCLSIYLSILLSICLQEHNLEAIKEMRDKLSSLWWSRLIIACRGYMCSFYANEGGSEDTLFCFDDAFIHLHKEFVENQPEHALECYKVWFDDSIWWSDLLIDKSFLSIAEQIQVIVATAIKERRQVWWFDVRMQDRVIDFSFRISECFCRQIKKISSF